MLCAAQRGQAWHGAGADDLPERGLYPRVAELRRVTVDGAGPVDLAQTTLHIGVAASSMQCAACNMYERYTWNAAGSSGQNDCCYSILGVSAPQRSNSEGVCECCCASVCLTAGMFP